MWAFQLKNNNTKNFNATIKSYDFRHLSTLNFKKQPCLSMYAQFKREKIK